MNAAHLHIILVHVPVVLVPVGCVILLFALLRKQEVVSRVALSILVFATLLAVPAFLLGEGAEEIAKNLPGVTEQMIEEHEEAADVAFWLTVATGLLSLTTLSQVLRGSAWHSRTMSACALLACVASGALGYAAHEGGKIRHPEAYAVAAGSETQGASDNDR